VRDPQFWFDSHAPRFKVILSFMMQEPKVAVDAVRVTVNELLSSVTHVRKSRLKTFAWATESLINGQTLSLTGLGRGSQTDALIKHSIKRADRFLGNEQMVAEADEVFRAVVKQLKPLSGLLIILVDWSKLDADYQGLCAAVAHDGRAIPILHEVHPTSAAGTPSVEEAFLERLRRIVGQGTPAVVVTDSGYRGPWVEAATKAGFDYVARLSPGGQLRVGDGPWEPIEEIAAQAGAEIEDLEACEYGKLRRLASRVVRGREYTPAPPRKRRMARKGNAAEKKRRRMARLPWMLATSLTDASAEDILEIYGMRMQIEEVFRDNKSPRFGWSLRHARPGSATRWFNLLLVAMVAHYVLHVVGRLAERLNLHRAFQANTERRRRVLSLVTLASAVLQSALCKRLTRSWLIAEIGLLRDSVAWGAKTGEQ
jgi:hypothetical protein